jgi:hypothetical protein
MPATAKKRYQNTTVRIPNQTYEKAKRAAHRAQIASFNEFVIQAVEEKVRRLTEAEIDAAFAGMADDTDYQRDSIAVAREFEAGDWEAFKSSERNEHIKTRAAKARPR